MIALGFKPPKGYVSLHCKCGNETWVHECDHAIKYTCPFCYCKRDA